MSAQPLRFQVNNPVFTEFLDTKTEPELLVDGCIWTEGPVWLHDKLYFNDIPNKRMLCWSESDGVSVALANSEFANGNTLGLDGRMLSCEHGGRRVIVRDDPTDLSSASVIADQFQGMPLNSPNDVVVKSDGSVWFTDPSYGIDSDVEGYQAVSEIGSNNVYRVDVDGSVHCVASDFEKPNGLAFSPNESILYIADSGAIKGAATPEPDYRLPHHIRAFDVVHNTLLNSRVLAVIEPGVPDGLRVDSEGYLWCSAGDGIRCLSPDGELIGKILMPNAVANCCFGGDSGSDLFITASDCVYRVRSSRQSAQSLKQSPH